MPRCLGRARDVMRIAVHRSAAHGNLAVEQVITLLSLTWLPIHVVCVRKQFVYQFVEILGREPAEGRGNVTTSINWCDSIVSV